MNGSCRSTLVLRQGVPSRYGADSSRADRPGPQNNVFFVSYAHDFAVFCLQRLCKLRAEELALMPRCSQSSQSSDCKITKKGVKNNSAKPENRSPRVQL